MGLFNDDNANPGGPGGRRQRIQRPKKKKGCCSMVAAVRSVKRGQFKLARRYATMSIKLITKKAAGSVIALVLIVAGAVLAAAVPAQADTIHSTPADTFALDQWVNYGGGHWQTSFYNIHLHSAGGITSCMNIAPATWPTNGDDITDNSASMVVNGEPYPDAWSNYTVYVFNWTNCNPDGGYDSFPGSEDTGLPDLSQPYYVNNTSIHLYHTITSIELIPNG
jgi:hypothetical protein